MRKIIFQVKRWLKRAQGPSPVLVEVRRAPESPRWDCVAGTLCDRGKVRPAKRVW
jgi:hypothetical protein